jgi:hypothetical protein
MIAARASHMPTHWRAKSSFSGHGFPVVRLEEKNGAAASCAKQGWLAMASLWAWLMAASRQLCVLVATAIRTIPAIEKMMMEWEHRGASWGG